MAIKNTCLSEKDKIKFNLQDNKKLAKLNSKTVEENKKMMMRKNLMINTQINPNHNEPALKTSSYNNIQSTVRTQINGADGQFNISPKPIKQTQRQNMEFSLNGSFMTQKQAVNYKPVLKLDRSKSKLKSNSILKQVSLSLDDSISKGINNLGMTLTSFNNNKDLKPNEKRSSSKRGNNKSSTSCKVSSVDISNLKVHLATQSKAISCISTKETNNNYCGFKNDGTMNIKPIISPSKQIMTSTNRKNRVSLLEQEFTNIINQSLSLDKETIEVKKRLTIQTGAEFSSRGLKPKNFKNLAPKTTQGASKGCSLIIDSSMLKEEQETISKSSRLMGLLEGAHDSKEAKHKKKLSTTNLTSQETAWSYYVDKYLKYLFTGKVMKFKEAIIVREENSGNNIFGYSCNVNKGIVRNYNEDRIVTILSLPKPKTKILEEDCVWPHVSFFAVYDGHGGTSVSEWLSENLHYYIINQASFPKDPKTAIFQGFKEAEETLLVKLMSCTLNIKAKQRQQAMDGNTKKHDTSGSCALVLLIVNQECFVANVGDSRALLSVASMSRYYSLTNDHKPDDGIEKKRIEENGGRLWKQDISPYRVIPGGLSVR